MCQSGLWRPVHLSAARQALRRPVSKHLPTLCQGGVFLAMRQLRRKTDDRYPRTNWSAPGAGERLPCCSGTADLTTLISLLPCVLQPGALAPWATAAATWLPDTEPAPH